MTDFVTLYGTDQPPEPETVIQAGRVELTFRGGAVSHLRVDGKELIRQIAFLARDRDWGTLVPEVSEVPEDRDGDAKLLRCRLTFQNGDSRLPVDLTLRVNEHGLDIEATGRVQGTFETNRTGFTVLHPITDQAGAPVTVRHADGRSEEACFPDLIAPWQPFKEIVAITHRVGNLACHCAFEGDVFEMEDQRQWGDASFKTYNRPLERPWPYRIADGEEVRQAVRLRWDDTRPAEVRPADERQAQATFPKTCLLVTVDHARQAVGRASDLEVVDPQRLLCHVDATLGDLPGQFGAFAALQREVPRYAFDLEYIGAFDRDPAQELLEAAAAMRVARFAPDSVMVCPSVDRRSTPPGSDWPECPPLEDIHRAARAAFDAPRMGGGMATFFPELNRKRPPVELLDFVTHALCPIVHDASDRAVMETLEAVPHITRSARAIIGGREYRIGPSTIAMRHNPYGSRTLPNTNNERVCMTDDDPRHRAAFGASYVVGLAAALAPAGVAVWTPAELYGPRGLFAPDGTPLPLAQAIAQLARCAGQEVISASIANGCAELRLSGAAFRANITADPLDGLAPYGWSAERRAL